MRWLTIGLIAWTLCLPVVGHAAAGDGSIWVTRSTRFNGFEGHVGIQAGTRVVHIEPWGLTPRPKTMTRADWLRRYPETIVIRPLDGQLGERAATEAVRLLADDTIRYGWSPNPRNIERTYAAELVWFVYAEAGHEWEMFVDTPSGGRYTVPWFVTPKQFAHRLNVAHNGFEWVDEDW